MLNMRGVESSPPVKQATSASLSAPETTSQMSLYVSGLSVARDQVEVDRLDNKRIHYCTRQLHHHPTHILTPD